MLWTRTSPETSPCTLPGLCLRSHVSRKDQGQALWRMLGEGPQLESGLWGLEVISSPGEGPPTVQRTHSNAGIPLKMRENSFLGPKGSSSALALRAHPSLDTEGVWQGPLHSCGGTRRDRPGTTFPQGEPEARRSFPSGSRGPLSPQRASAPGPCSSLGCECGWCTLSFPNQETRKPGAPSSVLLPGGPPPAHSARLSGLLPDSTDLPGLSLGESPSVCRHPGEHGEQARQGKLTSAIRPPIRGAPTDPLIPAAPILCPDCAGLWASPRFPKVTWVARKSLLLLAPVVGEGAPSRTSGRRCSSLVGSLAGPCRLHEAPAWGWWQGSWPEGGRGSVLKTHTLGTRPPFLPRPGHPGSPGAPKPAAGVAPRSRAQPPAGSRRQVQGGALSCRPALRLRAPILPKLPFLCPETFRRGAPEPSSPRPARATRPPVCPASLWRNKCPHGWDG